MYYKLKELLPLGEFIYGALTDAEIANVKCSMYMTDVDNKRYISVEIEQEELASKLILPTEEETAAYEASLAQAEETSVTE